MSIPISNGTGASSVAAEAIGGLQYQQVEIYGGGGASILGINPDRSINVSVIGVINANVTGSVVAAGNTSVSGTTGSSIIGHAPVVITSIATAGGAIPVTFAAGANQSVSGTVGASVIGKVPAFLTESSPASVIVVGTVAISNTSVNVGGSVVAFQGTTPWAATNVGSVITYNIGSVITVEKSSSIIAINAGSVVTISQGSVITVAQAPSIVGTYLEDAAHTAGDRGIFVLGVRNDTMASVTSADGDYTPMAQGPVGETIVAQAPITKWVQGTADLRTNAGGSVNVIAAQGSSIFTYIQSAQLANMGTASVLVTFSGATSSVVAYSIAPGGGGSNIIFKPAVKTNANGAFTASISGQASVLVSAQGFISKV